MAIKTSYTDEELMQYMENALGDTARKLNLAVEDGDFLEPLNNVLYALGRDDLTFVNSRALAHEVRLVATVEAWRMAMYNTAHLASHSVGAPGTGQTSRQDVHRFCQDMFGKAVDELRDRFPDSEANISEPSRTISSSTVAYTNDYEA